MRSEKALDELAPILRAFIDSVPPDLQGPHFSALKGYESFYPRAPKLVPSAPYDPLKGWSAAMAAPASSSVVTNIRTIKLPPPTPPSPGK